MKPTPFPDNTPDCYFEYHRVREGVNFFVSYYKNSARMTDDPKDCWRTLGVAKHTDTGKALKAWCLEMYETYTVPQMESWGKHMSDDLRPDTSFASSALEEASTEVEAEEESPTGNTKMVM